MTLVRINFLVCQVLVLACKLSAVQSSTLMCHRENLCVIPNGNEHLHIALVKLLTLGKGIIYQIISHEWGILFPSLMASLIPGFTAERLLPFWRGWILAKWGRFLLLVDNLGAIFNISKEIMPKITPRVMKETETSSRWSVRCRRWAYCSLPLWLLRFHPYFPSLCLHLECWIS